MSEETDASGDVKFGWTQYNITYLCTSIFLNVFLSVCVMILTYKYRQRDNRERKKDKMEERQKQRNELVNKILAIYFKLIRKPISRVVDVMEEKQKFKQYICQDEPNGNAIHKAKDAYGALYQDIENYAKLQNKREENRFCGTMYCEKGEESALYSLQYVEDICKDMDEVTEFLMLIMQGIHNDIFTASGSRHTSSDQNGTVKLPTEFQQIGLEKFIDRLHVFFLNYYDRLYGKSDIQLDVLSASKTIQLTCDNTDKFAFFAYLVFLAKQFLAKQHLARPTAPDAYPKDTYYLPLEDDSFQRVYNGMNAGTKDVGTKDVENQYEYSVPYPKRNALEESKAEEKLCLISMGESSNRKKENQPDDTAI